MSDREDSVSRSHSRSASSHKSVSPKRSNSRPRSISKKRSRSASKSPVRRSRSRSYRRESRSRSRDRKYSRSRSHSRRRRTRSRSRSYDRRRSTKYDRYERSSRSSYQYEKERSPQSDRRRHQGERVSRNGTHSPLSDRRRHQGDKDNPRKSRCLGVFGLNLRTQERDLREIFERYGQIEDLQIVYDHQTGRSRGFGFVYFKYIEDAIDAKEQATGLNLDGRNIRIDYSITERAHTPTPGVYLGRTAGAGMRYGRRSPSPYKGGAAHYSRSRSRSRSNSRHVHVPRLNVLQGMVLRQ